MPSGAHVPGYLQRVYSPGDGSKKESKKRIEDQLENFDKVFSPEKDTGPEKNTRNKETPKKGDPKKHGSK
jgi:hypothetical protein